MTKYIHELNDWPNLIYQESVVQSALLRTEKRQSEMLDRVRSLEFGSDNFLAQEISLSVLTADAVQTSAIEGERLPPGQVRSAIARRLGLNGPNVSPFARNVEGVVEMLVDAVVNRDEPVTCERLWNWHTVLLPFGYSGFHKITVGAWRTDTIHVMSGRQGSARIHSTAPDSLRVPGEMARFLITLGYK